MAREVSSSAAYAGTGRQFSMSMGIQSCPLPDVQKRSRRGAVFLSGKAPEGFREGSKREVFFEGGAAAMPPAEIVSQRVP